MKDNTWLTNKPIAHRGLFDNQTLPENSIPAFLNAIKHGFAIELDVQMTSDGTLVVFHDYNLLRMTSTKTDVASTTFTQLSKSSLLDTNCKIPTFDEMLQQVDGKAELLIEIKSHKNIGVLESKLASALDNYKGNFAIQSFDPRVIRWFKINKPNYSRGLLASNFKGVPLPWYQKLILKNLWLLSWSGSQFVSYDANSIETNNKVKRLKDKMPVLCWTVNTEEQRNKLCNYCDNIIFESFIPQKEDLS